MDTLLEAAGSAAPVRVLVFLTALTLLPGLIISMTAFLRIILVLGFLRNALGLQQMPPNQVLIGMSLFLTWFVMGDVASVMHTNAIRPYLDGQLQEEQLIEEASVPLRQFMLAQTRTRDLSLMLTISGVGEVETEADIPTRVVVPAFIVSELRTAFAIGFLLFIPFLIVDLSAAALLNALGMIMLPPTAISLPFKLLIFVVADGWSLVIGSTVQSFAV